MPNLYGFPVPWLVSTNLKDKADEADSKSTSSCADDAETAQSEPAVPAPPSVRVSPQCLGAARKWLGAPPYNTGCNFLAHDSYYSRSCIDKYGVAQWNAAVWLIRKELKGE